MLFKKKKKKGGGGPYLEVFIIFINENKDII